MIVQCTWCQHAFPTERTGRQFCPHCGAELDVPEVSPTPSGPEASGGEAPLESQSPPASTEGGGVVAPPAVIPPPPGGAGAWGDGETPSDRPAPWDRRRELGWFKAYVDTWKAASLEPTRFFEGLKTQDQGSAFLYAFLSGLVGSFATALSGLALSMSGLGSAWGFGPEQTALSIIQLVSVPLVVAVALWIQAAIVHLGCLVLGCGKRGFEATFRAFSYSQGPMIFGAIPIVGGLVGWIWSSTCLVFALAKMQRTTVGMAVLAVVLPGLVVLLCCCGIPLLLVGGFALSVPELLQH